MHSGASHLFAAIAWTLLHSIWQGSIAAASYAICRRCTSSASLRYIVGHSCLAIFVTGQVLTFAIADSSPLALVDWISGDTSAQPIGISGQTLIRKLPTAPFANYIAMAEPLLPWFGVLWLSFAVARLTWFAALIVSLHVELKRCTELAAPAIAKLLTLAERSGVKARFLECAAVSVPGTVGWLRPAVLVPVGWITSTPAGDIEAIILHELAHIARRDFLGKIMLTLVRSVYYFHVPLLWLSTQLEEEAEQATDAIAVKAHGDYEGYGAAFLRLEISSSKLSLAISAADGTLAARLRHLVEVKNGTGRHSGRKFIAAVVSCCLALLSITYTTASTASTDGELAWLTERDMTTSILETLASSRPNPQAEQMIARLRGVQTPTPAALKALAQSLRAGFDPTLLRREAESVPSSASIARAALPTFGTFRDRERLVQSLQDAALQSTAPAQRDEFMRAAIMLASLDLLNNSGSLASALILDDQVMKTLRVDAVSKRRLEYAVSMHNHRLAQLARMTASLHHKGRLSDNNLATFQQLSRYAPSIKRLLCSGDNAELRDQLMGSGFASRH